MDADIRHMTWIETDNPNIKFRLSIVNQVSNDFIINCDLVEESHDNIFSEVSKILDQIKNGNYERLKQIPTYLLNPIEQIWVVTKSEDGKKTEEEKKFIRALKRKYTLLGAEKFTKTPYQNYFKYSLMSPIKIGRIENQMVGLIKEELKRVKPYAKEFNALNDDFKKLEYIQKNGDFSKRIFVEISDGELTVRWKRFHMFDVKYPKLSKLKSEFCANNGTLQLFKILGIECILKF
jgi:hypothetical protein